MRLLAFINAFTGVLLMLVSISLILISLLSLWDVMILEGDPKSIYIFFLFNILSFMIFLVAKDIIKSVGQYQ